jgi:predicted nucleic acid-binding protein
MKIITIHDTNILIDFIELDLLPDFLKLGFEFHTTDFVLNEMVRTVQKKQIKQFESKFIIRGFEGAELLKLAEIQNTYRSLSIEDVSVMELSDELAGILCTGDKKLKNIAESRGIEVHGILWVIEQMVGEGLIAKKQAIENLERLKIINSMLSSELINKQIHKLNE